jgi:hypothetical protein
MFSVGRKTWKEARNPRTLPAIDSSILIFHGPLSSQAFLGQSERNQREVTGLGF